MSSRWVVSHESHVPWLPTTIRRVRMAPNLIRGELPDLRILGRETSIKGSASRSSWPWEAFDLQGAIVTMAGTFGQMLRSGGTNSEREASDVY